MYADPSNFVETNSGNHTYGRNALSATTEYYFGTSYTSNKNTRTYKLSGDIIQGTIGDDKVGYYTCFSSNKDASCKEMFYTTGYSSPTTMLVRTYSFGTTSREDALSNINNSSIKSYVDNWYKNNLNNYTYKISEKAYFCNDRRIASGLGYGMSITNYQPLDRVKNGKIDLNCPQIQDKFTVSNETGNGDLTYPIGLITSDEAMMAGGIYGSSNTLYYLYSGYGYWTMSPYQLNTWIYVRNEAVGLSGYITSDDGWTSIGVRPVINLDPDKITFTGNGTMQDPYVIS